MKIKEILKIAAKCVPLFTLAAYIIGFLIFAFYFTQIGVPRGINLFTYLEITDHIIIFGIGALLFLSTSSLLIFPSFIYDNLVKPKKENVGHWKSFIFVAIFLLGILIVGTFFIAALLSSIYPEIISSKKWLLIIFVILLAVTIFSIFVYQQDKTAGIMLPLVILVFLVIWYPQITIDFAGYGNYWACLTLTPSEGQSLKLNPKIENLLLQSCDGYWYTPQSVFIILQLRDYVFIAKDDKKIGAIEMISKKEAHIFHVTPAQVSKSCDSSKEKTT